MAKTVGAVAVCAALVGCSGLGVGPDTSSGASPAVNAVPAADTSADALVAKVVEVDLRADEGKPVCRKIAKSGSRIVRERCFAFSAADQAQAREELEVLREQARWEEQSRRTREASMGSMQSGVPRR